MQYWIAKQQHINDFVSRANQSLPEDNPLFFSGSFISGQTERPDILFIGINPGHRQWQDLAARKANTKLVAYEPSPCKYIEDAKCGNRFAKRVIDIACLGQVERLKHCAETSLLSYFAIPTESVIKAQIKQLPKPMQNEHRRLTELDLNAVNPKHIVCIGWRTFDEFIKRYESGNQDKNNSSKKPKVASRMNEAKEAPRQKIVTKQLPIAINGKDKNEKLMDYYARTEINGIPIHGVRHFSTPLSRAMIDDLKVIFKGVWDEIDQDSIY